MKYDVFISHAGEDKDEVARPLALELEIAGLVVWLDECQLTIGDSLRRSIDIGLSESRFGVVVLSPAFFSKEWPNKELDGLVARENSSAKVILPVWHNLNASEIARFSPLLAGKVAVSTGRGIENVAREIMRAVSDANMPKYVEHQVARYELELLARLREQMLLAKTSLELRRTAYELDEHLARYPHSPEARILKDLVVASIERDMEINCSRTMEHGMLGREKMAMNAPSTLALWAVLLGFSTAIVAWLIHQLSK